MLRENIQDLLAFVAVAKARSFTRAAVQLGISQSTLSHAIRELEKRLRIRLLTRTTRSVAPTEAGQKLLDRIVPSLDAVAAELAALDEQRAMPAGTIRLTSTDDAAEVLLRPKLARFLPLYPDIKVEIFIDNGLTNIVTERFDAGVRLGDMIARDMVAVRIGPDVRFAVVATPAYFAAHAAPAVPQDLLHHNCINLRLPTRGNIYAWEFDKDGRAQSVRTNGQMVFNSGVQILRAAVDGLGLAYVAEDLAAPFIAEGRLQRVLDDFCPAGPGYHLYYPSRLHSSIALTLLIDALRHRE